MLEMWSFLQISSGHVVFRLARRMIVCTESPLDEVKRDIAYLQGRYDYLLEYVQDVAHSHSMLAGRLHSLKWRLVELRDEFEGHLEASGKLMAEFEEIQKSLASAQRMLQLVPGTP